MEQKESSVWRKRKQQILEKTKTLSDYKNELQKEVNTIVRLIDLGQPCIATGATKGKRNAGHYISVGSNPTLRYNLHNIHIQSEHSNSWKSGDTIRYQEGLKKIYSQQYFDFIESLKSTPPINLSIDQIKDSIESARKIIKELKSTESTYTPDQRIELRNKFNKRINIYHTSFLIPPPTY